MRENERRKKEREEGKKEDKGKLVLMVVYQKKGD